MQKRYFGSRINSFKRPQEKTTSKTRLADAERKLINAESALGRMLFGEVQPGHQREFFCLQKNVWIWYEDGKTIRYEVRESGVYKKVDKGNYAKISGKELENFRAATKAYLQLVKMNLYKA